MNQLDGLRRYLEAATTLTQITRGRAEELVRDLVASGELERTRAQEWIDDLLKRSREASDALIAQVSTEVDHQLGERLKSLDLEDLAAKVAALIGMAGTVGRNVVNRNAPNGSEAPAPPKSPKKKTSSKGSGEKGTSAKSSTKASSKKKDSGKQNGKGASSKKSEAKKEPAPSEATT